NPVQIDLAEQLVGQKTLLGVQHGGGALVAGGLQRKDSHAFCLCPKAHLESPALLNLSPPLRFRCRAFEFEKTSISMPPYGVSSAPAKRPEFSPSCGGANSTRSPPRSGNAKRPRRSSGT